MAPARAPPRERGEPGAGGGDYLAAGPGYSPSQTMASRKGTIWTERDSAAL